MPWVGSVVRFLYSAKRRREATAVAIFCLGGERVFVDGGEVVVSGKWGVVFGRWDGGAGWRSEDGYGTAWMVWWVAEDEVACGGGV